MAIITKFTYEEMKPKSRKTAEAKYCFTADGGLQIISTGSKDRMVKDGKSQNMYFSPEILKQLVEELKKHGHY